MVIYTVQVYQAVYITKQAFFVLLPVGFGVSINSDFDKKQKNPDWFQPDRAFQQDCQSRLFVLSLYS